MKIGVNLNDKSEIIVAYSDDINGETVIEVSDEEFSAIFDENLPFKVIDNKLVLNESKISQDDKNQKINELKDKLKETDYVVIKSVEYQIKGLTPPQNYLEIMDEREQWRKAINELEA